MADIPLTQEQRDALHARGLNDEAISFLKSAEEADQIIRNVTPERAQEIFRKAALELSSQVPPPERDNKVIHLAERAQEVLEITELEPASPKFFAGKYINLDGTMTPYRISDGDRDQHVKHWWQRAVRVPATIPHLFAYTRAAQKRNVCLIRGTPVNPDKQPTRRLKARSEQDDEGFYDAPSLLVPFDGDGIKIPWLADPKNAVRSVVAMMGEPWASTSFVWFFTSKHGLEFDANKRWTGRIVDGEMYVRLLFIGARPLYEDEVRALTTIAQVGVSELDPRIYLTVQENYIRRPHWVRYPNLDPLGDIPTIGLVRGACERLSIPEHLAHTARWAKAQGNGANIAEHPNAEAAVRAIGSDNDVRPHVQAAVIHLLIANPIPDVTSFHDHSINIIAKLRHMIAQHRKEISNNLVRNGRSTQVVDELLQHTKTSWPLWCLHHPKILRAKTIKLVKEERAKVDDQTTREASFDRVERIIRAFCAEASASQIFREQPLVRLLVAPVGSGKSTRVRAEAVRFVIEHPGKSAVILTPRHKLNVEQLDRLREEHPGHNYIPAIWRGRYADNPNNPDPEHPGKFLPMCIRSEEAQAVEKVALDVERTLCKRGRGDQTIKCPFFDTCAFQQQKLVKANLWFAAHECAVHEMPKMFGDVSWVIFDESPLDAFMYGVDSNDQVTFELSGLRTPLAELGGRYPDDEGRLMGMRRALCDALERPWVPIGSDQGVATPRESLEPFISTAKEMWALTWRAKVTPDIRPDMSEKQVKAKLKEAVVNSTIKTEAMLWKLIEAMGEHELYGRIQVHHVKDERPFRTGLRTFVRMVGLNQLVEKWNVPTLICDATGDVELLRMIWPQLEEPEPHGWEQLPRPPNVRVFQCVNRTISKWAVAIEGKNRKELKRKVEGARQLYAAVLMKALQYGGADVGVIVYKSTKEWIQKNCFVPSWMKLVHWGDVTGTNTLQYVRALFVIGRPLAAAEDATRLTEALFGGYIPQREYVVRRKQGRIPIVPDVAGNTHIRVDVQEHPHPMGERLRRQITEGNIIQAIGRARAGLRAVGDPLDLHLWTDVPIPELGPVEPMLWSELGAGPDGLMLATKGCRLSNIADAVRAFEGLFSADGLKDARARAPRMNEANPAFIRVFYQRAGAGCKPTDAMFLKGVANPRGWLEERLGALAWFKVQQEEGKDEAV